MTISAFLERNAQSKPDDIALVELNPEQRDFDHPNWREYSLVEPDAFHAAYRKQITWQQFDANANKFANLLRSKGFKKGDKIAILLMNCIEWLPIYFGILKAGCIAVPLNFRYASDEIDYCLKLSDSACLVFGLHFVDRLKPLLTSDGKLEVNGSAIPCIYSGDPPCPEFAEDYEALTSQQSEVAPDIGVTLSEQDDGAIYFSSGTTGFPKAILHKHRSLITACEVEQAHHAQCESDVFLCIPPLYHTGAKMHWFGSLISGGRAVILRGTRPDWIVEAVSAEHATIVWLLVPWAQDILDAIDRGEIKLDSHALSQWRLMHIGAQPVPP
ncbi:MAG: long-chain fatty acid--CoA ligase, partial [Oscillospiraceae bacterium]|nr:long-chain fatty acid--CoA ligase [Oscillospiraceae bacterium]